MSTTITVEEAQAKLKELIHQMGPGEEVIITENQSRQTNLGTHYWFSDFLGRPPFRAARPLDTVLQVLQQEPVPPNKVDPQVDRDRETICLKCLEKKPAKRYNSAEALAE